MEIARKKETVYIKAEQQIQVSGVRGIARVITLGEAVTVYSADSGLEQKISRLCLITMKRNRSVKYIFSILKVIELIKTEDPSIEVVNLGESDFIIDYRIPKKTKKYLEYVKTVLVCLAVFCGSGFTIMTFNQDVSVTDVFGYFYQLVLGRKAESEIILEISYSIGLSVGIIVFFNHFSKLKIHDDPTPMQTQMRLYEEDANKTLIQNASRKGKTIDCN